MPGKKSTKRTHAAALRAANMKAEGHTTPEIAEAVGRDPKRVETLVLLGERLRQVESTTIEDGATIYESHKRG